MNEQNFKNHTRVYFPHFFIVYPLCLLILIISVYGLFTYGEDRTLWILLTLISILITWTSVMLRQHYGLKNQDRIIRLEMRLRYFQLTGERFDPVEAKLKFKHIAALRFASDEELPALVKKAVDENLSPDTIKRSIIKWHPDHMRV